MMTKQPPETSRAWNLDGIAIALIAVGALLLALCGSCTGVFAGSAIWGLITGPHQEDGLALVMLIVAGVFGGVPTLGGFVLLMAGLRRARPPRKPPPATVD